MLVHLYSREWCMTMLKGAVIMASQRELTSFFLSRSVNRHEPLAERKPLLQNGMVVVGVSPSRHHAPSLPPCSDSHTRSRSSPS